jgi:AcrR family transcriptional regulator
VTQKTFYTKEAILEAAFTLAREQGWRSVTARGIAKKLGSSTMPIYSGMKSMAEIEAEVRRRAEALLLEFQGRNYGGDTAMNAAIGYVTFARDERYLFRFLYIERPAIPKERRGEMERVVTFEQFLAGAKPASLSEQVPTAMRDPRILKSWIFTHGLASLLSAGVLDLPDEKVRSLLLESGAAFFGRNG